MKHGPTWHEDDSVTFRLWAPSAQSVQLKLMDATHAMLALEDGWYELRQQAAPGMRYQFIIDEGTAVPDPASRYQPKGVHGPSALTPPHWTWNDEDWKGRPWEEAVLYELHVGTFSESGDFAGVEAKLDYLKSLGVTAVELMPVAEFDGARGWGYDGVLPYAPHAPYGRPEELKKLVDAAHQRGLMMFLDVVYNHFGPSGNYLQAYAKPFFTEKYKTPWGAAIDFSQPAVRDFFIENALYWLREFHFDGLRFDAVHAITDTSERHILTELAERVRDEVTGRYIQLVLENDKNEAHHLDPHHYNAQWNDDSHHVFHVLATGEKGGYYSEYKDNTLERLGRVLTQGFEYQGDPSAHRKGERRGEPSAHLPPTAFVNFTQNHDQIGNRALGDRLSTLADAETLAMLRAILLLSPAIPMLYMGEEWASKTPFLYFCDFEGELASAVREGRRREFESFPEFADPAMREKIPDPNALETFEASHLQWSDLEQEEFKKVQQQVRQLLGLRAEHILPLLQQGIARALFDKLAERAIEVRWESENEIQLQLLANFGDSPVEAKRIEGDNLWGVEGDTLPPRSCVFTIGKLHA